MITKATTCPCRPILHALLAVLMAVVIKDANAMTPIEDSELAAVTGQALFVADYIAPNQLAGNQGAGSVTDFGFYRMGLDVQLDLNANIDKMQLGCGGFNESIASNACDIDMDFVRLMGLNNTLDGPSPNGPASDFSLVRPYIEIAVKGAGLTTREVAGIKIGAETANGFFGVGRRYANGATNLENGGTCGTGSPDARAACHSGLNRVSGFLDTELSGQFPVAITGLGTQTACFGDHAFNSACNTPYRIQIIGSRLSEMYQESVPLTLSAGFLEAIGIDQAYATIQQRLRFIHGFALSNTSDFFMSFQRERIAYPRYNKSGYAYAANAGWWMSVPDLSVKNFTGDEVSLGLGEAIDALGEPGPVVRDSELNVSPPNNCYNSIGFC